jgi:hypothetical protein
LGARDQRHLDTAHRRLLNNLLDARENIGQSVDGGWAAFVMEWGEIHGEKSVTAKQL